jgi:hypothetical protein
LRSQGYAIIPNPRWGWETDNQGAIVVLPEDRRIGYQAMKQEIEEMEKAYDKIKKNWASMIRKYPGNGISSFQTGIMQREAALKKDRELLLKKDQTNGKYVVSVEFQLNLTHF